MAQRIQPQWRLKQRLVQYLLTVMILTDRHGIVPSCQAFMEPGCSVRQRPSTIDISHVEQRSVAQHQAESWRLSLSSSAVDSESQDADSTASGATMVKLPTTLDELVTEITRLCDSKSADDVATAADILEQWNFQTDNKTSEVVEKMASCYITVLEALATTERDVLPDAAPRSSKLFDKLVALEDIDSWALSRLIDITSLTIKVWTATPSEEGASVECQSLLEKIWSLYRRRPKEQQQISGKEALSLKECYFHTIRACSMRDRGADAAKLAETLMEEMESRGAEFPQLTPDKRIVKEVMNAWSKSGLTIRAGTKCEALLHKLIEGAEGGSRPDMEPDAASFNIVISALAQGKEKVPGSRAESLLYKMEDLNSRNGWNCAPDQTSFNSVINNWASKRDPGATERAITILDHMRKRSKAGVTAVNPDGISYSTVLTALSKSREPDAIKIAERMFQQYQEDVANEQWDIEQYSLAWNSMINCYAKSKRTDAGEKALALLETMKTNAGKPGWGNCFVDVYTYTTVIDAIAKDESYQGSKKAVALLEELEKSYEETNDRRFQPNILLYTAAVNAIGRSHKEPERAQQIVDRVESSFLQATSWKPKPDVLFYNALINAYGWSDMQGKSRKCAEVLQHMIDLSDSRKLPNARPDIISFNSVLNACAYEKPSSKASNSDILEIATETYERLCSGRGDQSFGRPDLSTYIQMMINIVNHIPRHDERRGPMAEAVFFRCAEDGLVGPAIVSKLAFALPKPRFQSIMGDAIDKEKHNAGKLVFDVSLLPQSWTAKLPWLQGGRVPSRGRRLKSNYQMTKNALSHSARK